MMFERGIVEIVVDDYIINVIRNLEGIIKTSCSTIINGTVEEILQVPKFLWLGGG